MILRGVECLGSSETRSIVVEGHTIREISPKEWSAKEQIAFDGAIAFPGLINSHDHLEFDAYEKLDGGPYIDYVEWAAAIRDRHMSRIAAVESIPRQTRVRFGIAKNLFCGVTSVAHHGPSVEFRGSAISLIPGTRSIHSPRLEGIRGLLMPDRRRVVAHVGEGTGVEAEKEIDDFVRWNFWRKRLIGVHAIAMRTDQAGHFTAIVWCPMSNEFLYGATAPVSRLKHHTSVLFGTDSTLTAPWNIWTHIRRARELNQLSDDELFAALTTKAARVWGLGNRGTIDTGAVADIVIARKRYEDQYEAFFAVDPRDILLVMKNGKVVLIDGSLKSQWRSSATLFPVTVNGVEKLTSEDFREMSAFAA
jgi:cytosine/adenosine deaminase-related metal-dependent hydrolase